MRADPVALHAGGGLLRPQDEPKAVSVVGSDFIARQAPSATAFDLVALLPGARARPLNDESCGVTWGIDCDSPFPLMEMVMARALSDDLRVRVL
ncbi:hypothetical protein OQ252_13270, partial [Acetobacter farinalis]|nr:hypothetical protein [Acetobacter farinalis]